MVIWKVLGWTTYLAGAFHGSLGCLGVYSCVDVRCGSTGLALNDCPDTVIDFNFSDVKTTLVNTLLIECFIGATYPFPITRQLTAETAAS